MRRRFSQMMQGKYGNDELNRTLMITSMGCLAVSLITKWDTFYMIGIILLICSYFRMFSRNIPKRTKENMFYKKKTNQILSIFTKKKKRLLEKKDYRFYRCPSCHQEVRVPRGKGKISITCPKCRTQFIKRS